MKERARRIGGYLSCACGAVVVRTNGDVAGAKLKARVNHTDVLAEQHNTHKRRTKTGDAVSRLIHYRTGGASGYWEEKITRRVIPLARQATKSLASSASSSLASSVLKFVNWT
jgi:hypothetical protein